MRSLKYPVQLSLFDTTIIKNEYLMAPKSPREAFYNIWLIQEPWGFVVKKESGGKMKKLDTRNWSFQTLPQAERFFERKIKEKTSPDRKTRVYQRVS